MQKQSDLETKLSNSLTNEQCENFERYLLLSANLIIPEKFLCMNIDELYILPSYMLSA